MLDSGLGHQQARFQIQPKAKFLKIRELIIRAFQAENHCQAKNRIIALKNYMHIDRNPEYLFIDNEEDESSSFIEYVIVKSMEAKSNKLGKEIASSLITLIMQDVHRLSTLSAALQQKFLLCRNRAGLNYLQIAIMSRCCNNLTKIIFHLKLAGMLPLSLLQVDNFNHGILACAFLHGSYYIITKIIELLAEDRQALMSNVWHGPYQAHSYLYVSLMRFVGDELDYIENFLKQNDDIYQLNIYYLIHHKEYISQSLKKKPNLVSNIARFYDLMSTPLVPNKTNDCDTPLTSNEMDDDNKSPILPLFDAKVGESFRLLTLEPFCEKTHAHELTHQPVKHKDVYKNN